jgi:hypothetical protein
MSASTSSCIMVISSWSDDGCRSFDDVRHAHELLLRCCIKFEIAPSDLDLTSHFLIIILAVFSWFLVSESSESRESVIIIL